MSGPLDVGRTGRIGLGLAALGRPAYITGSRDALGAERSVEHLRARSHAVLDQALALGLRYVDAARSYGLAEDFVASWLADRPGGPHPVVASKWGYTYVGGWDPAADVHEVKDHSLPAFERQQAETLTLLGGVLDLYSIHSVTPDSPALHDRALIERLAAWSAEHDVRLGISTSGPQQGQVVREALGVEVDGQPVFAAVQSTWNLLEPSAGAALTTAADAGWLVVVKEGVANGRLAGGEAPPALVHAAHTAGVGPDSLALAAALAQPFTPVVLSGAVTADQLASNVAASDVDPDLARRVVADLSQLVEPPDVYWRTRSGRPWA